VGNTQKDPGRFTSLYNGVVEKVFGRLPDETWVYPPSSTSPAEQHVPVRDGQFEERGARGLDRMAGG
jgi:hypothetical protein